MIFINTDIHNYICKTEEQLNNPSFHNPIRFLNPYRLKGKLVTISQNDWDKINIQLEILYKLRPLSK